MQRQQHGHVEAMRFVIIASELERERPVRVHETGQVFDQRFVHPGTLLFWAKISPSIGLADWAFPLFSSNFAATFYCVTGTAGLPIGVILSCDDDGWFGLSP